MKTNLFEQILILIEDFVKNHDIKSIQNPPLMSLITQFQLANFFNYNVRKGGFAQLLYNLKGEYLQDIELLLSEWNAPVALNFYKKSIEICLNNLDEYQRFINGDYPENNEVKHSLQLISIEYFNQKAAFEDEVEDFLAKNHEDFVNWLKS